MESRRPYTMRARAASVEETRRRILDALFALSAERPVSDISLDDVARAASVSVQTVLRRFGSRAGLLEETAEHAAGLVAQERRAPPGDLQEAMRLLLDHYERRGDATVLLLAQERVDDVLAGVVERGRRLHRDWNAEVFAGALAAAPAERREELLDLLVVATDVYTWKLLRRDRGLGRSATEARMTTLVTAVLAATGAAGRTPPWPTSSS
jgi:AcrR family transcriptional regulator